MLVLERPGKGRVSSCRDEKSMGARVAKAWKKAQTPGCEKQQAQNCRAWITVCGHGHFSLEFLID